MKSSIKLTFILFLYIFISTYSIAAASNNLNFKYTNPSANQLRNLKIKISPDVTLNAEQYLKKSNFKNRKDFKNVFTNKFRSQHLKKSPQYHETVEALGDRLKVTRTLTLDFKNPCDKNLKKSISFCFKKNKKKWVANKAQKKELDTMRNTIRNKLKAKAIRNKEEQKQLKKILAMNDSQMIEYILNHSSTEKTMVQTSILPLIPIKLPANKKINLTNINKKLVKAKVTPPKYSVNLTKIPKRTLKRKLTNIPAITNANTNTSTTDTYNPDGYRFDNKNHYSINLAMGKVYSDGYGDTYTLTFARKTWWHKRYFASFTYNFGYAFGLQFPFKLDVNTEVTTVIGQSDRQHHRYPHGHLCNEATDASEAHLCSYGGIVKIKARPATERESNVDFYRNAGISNQDDLNNKEFIFQIGLTCSLRLVVPFYSTTYHCPGSANVDEGDHFEAPLGPGNRTLVDYILPFDLARRSSMGIDAGLGYALLRPGVRIKGNNASLKFDVSGERARILQNTNQLTLTNSEKIFSLHENQMRGEFDWGLKLRNPKYQLGITLVPTVAASIGIGIAGYGWNQLVGPFDINSLSIDLGSYNFSPLNNTPAEHVFITGRRRD